MIELLNNDILATRLVAFLLGDFKCGSNKLAFSSYPKILS